MCDMNEEYWNIFKNIGSVESYLLLNDIEKITDDGDDDATENQGSDS